MGGVGGNGKMQRSLRAVCVMFVLVLGIFAVQNEGYTIHCFNVCFRYCVLNPFASPGICAGVCFFKCLPMEGNQTTVPPPPPYLSSTSDIVNIEQQQLNYDSTDLIIEDDLHFYCKLGCAAYRCTYFAISSPQDIRDNEIEGCLDSCSTDCLHPRAPAPQINN